MSAWFSTVHRGKLGVDASKPAGQSTTTAGKQDSKVRKKKFAQ
jgi:hypothetical protein